MATYRAKPPKGALLNRADPLGRIIARSWWFDERSPNGTPHVFRDAVAGDTVTYTRQNADTLTIGSHHGRAFQGGADGGGAVTWRGAHTLSRYGFQNLTGTRFSVAARFQRFGSNPDLESMPGGGGGSIIFRTRRVTADIGMCLFCTSSGFKFAADGPSLLAGAQSSASLTLGQWYTVVGTCDGATWSVYVDGIFQGSNNYNVAGSFAGTLSDVAPSFNQDLDGLLATSDKRIDYLHVFRDSLTPSMVKALYADPFRMFRRRYIPVPLQSPAAADQPFNNSMWMQTL